MTLSSWSVHLHFAESSPDQRLCRFDPQPLSSDCGRFTLVLSGELSNQAAIRRAVRPRRWRSDRAAETVVEGIAQRGAAILLELRGSFSLACWDQQRRRLLVAGDRFGTCPPLLCPSPAGIALASCPDRLAEKPTSCLPAGVLLWIAADGEQRQLRWWPSWPAHPWPPLPLHAAAQARALIRRELERVVDEQLEAFAAGAPVAIWSDGSLTSAILSALVRQRRPGAVQIFDDSPATGLDGLMATLRQCGHAAVLAACPGDALLAAGACQGREAWTRLVEQTIPTTVRPPLAAAHQAGVALRLPLLDPQLVEMCLRLPAGLRRRQVQLWLESCADLLDAERLQARGLGR